MANQKIERPVLAVDVVVFSLHERGLHVLLLKRAAEPFSGALALPGVAVQLEETLEAAARRSLRGKTALDRAAVAALHLEQLATFDALYRDPRGRTVSVAYMGLIASSSAGSGWQRLTAVDRGSLPFDHDVILEAAVKRLQGKLRYTNIAARLLPDTFRIEELQAIYEAVLGQRLNRANFRNKLLKIGLIEQAGVLSDTVGKKGGRPPHLYRFPLDDVAAWDRDFL